MCVMVVLAVTGVVSANLLTNGDFNNPESMDAPTGWTIWCDSGWVNHEVISPAAGLVGVYDGTWQMSLGGDSGGARGIFQVVAGTENEEYTLTMDAGAQDWWLPNGSFYLKFLDAGDTELASHEVDTTAGIHNPDQYDTGIVYQEFNITATAPAGTTQVKVECAEWAGSGTVWFDNAVLVPEPATVAFLGIGCIFFCRRKK
jgi:hypothetical protein